MDDFMLDRLHTSFTEFFTSDKADYYCDYIPVASTVKNIVNISQMVFQKINQKLCPKYYDQISDQNKNYFKHLDTKTFTKCLLLLIPVVNIFVAFYYANKTFESLNKHDLIIQSSTGNSLKGFVKLRDKEKMKTSWKECTIKLIPFGIRSEKRYKAVFSDANSNKESARINVRYKIVQIEKAITLPVVSFPTMQLAHKMMEIGRKAYKNLSDLCHSGGTKSSAIAQP